MDAFVADLGKTRWRDPVVEVISKNDQYFSVPLR